MGRQARTTLAAVLATLAIASSLVAPAAALAGPSEPHAIAGPSLLDPPDGASSTANPLLRWAASANALAYEVEAFTTPDLTGSTGCNGWTEVPHLVCPDLRPNVYYWHVRAIGVQNQLGAWSAARQFIVLPGLAAQAPSLIAPANGAILDYPNGLALLRWSPIPDAGHYQVQFADDPTFPGPEPGLAYGTIDTETLRVPLSVVGRKQYWRVRAVSINQASGGPWSAARSFTVRWTDSVSLLSPADDATVSAVRLVWQPVLTGRQYEIQVAAVDDPGFASPLGTTYAETTSIPWPAATGTSFRWRVRAMGEDTALTSWSASRVVHVDDAAPAAPAAPTIDLPAVQLTGPADGATGTTPGTNPFDFDLINGAVGYQLQVTKQGQAFWSDDPTPFDNVVQLPPVTWNLDGATSYAWRVRATGPSNTHGPWSGVRQFTTAAQPPVTLLAPADGSTVANEGLVFRWLEHPVSRVYNVEISKTPDFANATLIGTDEPSAVLRNALDPGLYYWRVTAGRNAALAVSPVRTMTIVDTSPPVGRNILLGGATWTSVDATSLELPAEDAVTSVTKVALSPDGTTWTTRDYPMADSTWPLTQAPYGSDPGPRSVWARWMDAAGNWSEPVVSTLTYGPGPAIDTTPPVVGALRFSIVDHRPATGGRVAVRLSWTASDPDSGVRDYNVGREVDGRTVPGIANLETPELTLILAPNHQYQFFVQATDTQQNTSAPGLEPPLRPASLWRPQPRDQLPGNLATAGVIVIRRWNEPLVECDRIARDDGVQRARDRLDRGPRADSRSCVRLGERPQGRDDRPLGPEAPGTGHRVGRLVGEQAAAAGHDQGREHGGPPPRRPRRARRPEMSGSVPPKLADKGRLLASVDAATGARTPARRPRSRAARGGAGDERPGRDPRRARAPARRGSSAGGRRTRSRPGSCRRTRCSSSRSRTRPRARWSSGCAPSGLPGVTARTFHAHALSQLRHFWPSRHDGAAAARSSSTRRSRSSAGSRASCPATTGSRRRRTSPTRSSGRSRAGSVRARTSARSSASTGPRAADPGRPLRPASSTTTSGPRRGPGPHRLRRPARRDRAPARGRRRRRRDRPRPQALVQRRRVPGHEPAPAAAARAVARRPRATCASSATRTRRSTRSPARHRTT